VEAAPAASLILVVEDDPAVRKLLYMTLSQNGYGVECAADGGEALPRLTQPGDPIALMLLNLSIPGRNGIEILREIRFRGYTLPIIAISGQSTPEQAAEAIKSGADDFLSKPFRFDDLHTAIHRALRTRVAAVDESRYRMSMIEASLDQVASSDVPVLLQGESGVGKEVLGRKLHAKSQRAAKPFLKINCAALPSDLLESELFGYERGAFTGADQCKPGLFELAQGGTILLDEIGDMDIRLQAKLLQVLQDHEFRRVGGKEVVRVDVRILAATNRNLSERIQDGEFRADLFYRLNVIAICLPPLRERKGEILSLAQTFWEKYGVTFNSPPEIPPLLKKALLDYHWPGNIRELENVIRRFLVLQNAEAIATELNRARHTAPAAQRPVKVAALEQVEIAKKEAESQLILQALRSANWNRRKAAAELKIDYRALLYKIKRLSIEEQSIAQSV
jgi:two-component system response regulator AtoC